jgi:hypothetical protein
MNQVKYNFFPPIRSELFKRLCGDDSPMTMMMMMMMMMVVVVTTIRCILPSI